MLLVACVVRRDHRQSALRYGIDLLAAFIAGMGISLISGGAPAGIQFIVACVCAVDLFEYIAVDSSIEYLTLLSIVPVLFFISGTVFAAATPTETRYLWPAITSFVGCALRSIFPVNYAINNIQKA